MPQRKTRPGLAAAAILFLAALTAGSGLAQEAPVSPAPPTAARWENASSGAHCEIVLRWTPSADDRPGGSVTGYRVLRAEGETGAFEEVGTAEPGANSLRDTDCRHKTLYRYQVVALAGDAASAPADAGSVTLRLPLVDRTKANVFFLALIISAAIIYYISHAKAGKRLFIRKIAGLEAVDEAIGRATEMGRPIVFIPGILDMNYVETVAAVTILGRIARTIAEYDTRLYCPTSKSLVMTTARETVKEAYLSAGRPDAYSDDMITYLTDEQFGYVAAVNGMMVREKPATCFYLGAFFAESLMLAETGNSIGAIQVAGTAQPAQLPFFIAACDYTLIGEELFAASAYLSHEPRQLGSLKGQDVGKGIAMLAILVGTILETIAATAGHPGVQRAAAWFHNLFTIQQ